MNRREFTFRLSALAAAPALPVPAMASGFEASEKAKSIYKWAEVISRTHNKCSKDMLMRLLKVDASIANDLQHMLLNRGVITQAVNGVSMAVKPLNTNCIPKQALKPTNIKALAEKTQDHLTAKLKETIEDAENTPDTQGYNAVKIGDKTQPSNINP